MKINRRSFFKKGVLFGIVLFFIGSIFVFGAGYLSLDGEVKNLNIRGNLVFYYYKNLSQAVKFYEETLGLKRVLDYGFAKIFQISKSSFIGLVDEKEGMHKSNEPKTVTLSFITDQTDEWFGYLKEKGVKILHPLKSSSRIHIRGFVAKDPEGYLLEFQKFLEHEMNTKLSKKLKKLPTYYTKKNSELAKMGFKGNIIWLYFNDLKKAQHFYENNLGMKLLCNQNTSLVMKSSISGFIGLVDQAHGLHKFTKKKAVNVSFLVNDIKAWYDVLKKRGMKIPKPPAKVEKGRVKAFLTKDLAEYTLEFDEFLKHRDNQRIIKAIHD